MVIIPHENTIGCNTFEIVHSLTFSREIRHPVALNAQDKSAFLSLSGSIHIFWIVGIVAIMMPLRKLTIAQRASVQNQRMAPTNAPRQLTVSICDQPVFPLKSVTMVIVVAPKVAAVTLPLTAPF